MPYESPCAAPSDLVSNLHLMASSKEEDQLIDGSPTVRRRVSSHRFAVFYLLVTVACIAVVYVSSKYSQSREFLGSVDFVGQDPELVWGAVSICSHVLSRYYPAHRHLLQVPPTPVDNLVWISCYKGLQCAKMTVKRSPYMYSLCRLIGSSAGSIGLCRS